MKPVWKWVIGVAAGMIVVVAVANWYVHRTLRPKMEAELKARVAEGTDGRYTLTYDRLDVSLLAGSATATNIRLMPTLPHDTTQRPAARYDIRISRLKVTGVALLRLLVTRKLHIHTIAIDTPSVHITRYKLADTTAATDAASGGWLARLTEARQLAGTTVKRIAIRAGEFERTNHDNAGHLRTQQINATLRDIRIDSAALHDTTRFYGAKAIQVEAAAMDYTRPDSLYRLHTGLLHFATATGELLLHDIHYGLMVSKAAFYRQVQLAEDIGDIAIARIALAGIDVPRWMRARTIAASALHIDSGSIAIYKDKTQPNPPENKIGRSPHQQLLRWEQRVAIDSVLIDALDIRFTEVSDQTGEAGTVTFEATTAVINHITNDSLELAHDRYMQLRARSRVMGAGDLTVDFRFDLLDSLGTHTYRATLGAMSGTAFNSMLKPHLHLEIEQAAIQGLRFDMTANDRRTTGTLQLDYDNLNVNMLREDRDGEKSTKKIASFFANRFLLNDSNPDANGEHHTGQVYIERPYSFSFFKMIWRSIREGTKECIGLGKG